MNFNFILALLLVIMITVSGAPAKGVEEEVVHHPTVETHPPVDSKLYCSYCCKSVEVGGKYTTVCGDLCC
uniref:Pollen allergen ole e 6 n=1 Tax=Caenorhabditis tropicalis TaxID=1561998 RepID=A0A1I7UP19_9PELO